MARGMVGPACIPVLHCITHSLMEEYSYAWLLLTSHSSLRKAMDLILWRHADAEEGYPDLARQLTGKGHRQAEAMAKWLRARLPKETLILVSPAARAQQTAQALTSHYQTVNEIGPGADHRAIVKAAGWPGSKSAVLIVGHQPTLGQAVGSLLCDDPSDWHIKKGAVWWLTQKGTDAPVFLQAAIPPDLV